MMTLLNPFHLPEICIHLVPYLDEGTTFNCLLVCRSWYRIFLPGLYDTLPLTPGFRISSSPPLTSQVESRALWFRVKQYPKLLKGRCMCEYGEDRHCITRLVRRTSHLVRELIIPSTAALTEKWILQAQQDSCHLGRGQDVIRHRRRIAKGLASTEEVNSSVLPIFTRLQHLTFDPVVSICGISDRGTLDPILRFMAILRGSQSTLLSLSENWFYYSREQHIQFATLFLEWLQESAQPTAPPLTASLGEPLKAGARLRELRLSFWRVTLETINGIIELCPNLTQLTLTNVDILSPRNEIEVSGTLPTATIQHSGILTRWHGIPFLDTRQLTTLSLTNATLPTERMDFYCPDLRILNITIRENYSPEWEGESYCTKSAVSSKFTWTLPQIEKIRYNANKWDPMGLFGAALMDYPATALGWSRDVRDLNKYASIKNRQKDTDKTKARKRPLDEWPSDTLRTLLVVGSGLSRRQVARMTYPANHLVNLNLSWDPLLDGRGILRILTGCHHLRRLVIAGVYLWLDEHMKTLEEKPWVCHGLEELSILVSVSRKNAKSGGIRYPHQFQDHLISGHARPPVADPILQSSPCASMKTRYSGKNSAKQLGSLRQDQDRLLKEQAAMVTNVIKQHQGIVQAQPLCIDHPVLPILLKRISELTRLQELNLGEGFNDVGLCCGLPWTLRDGLGQLAPLKEMRVFHLTSWAGSMGLPEIKWMVANWPGLSKIVLRDRDIGCDPVSHTLRKNLRSLGSFRVEVCFRHECITPPSDDLYFSSDKQIWRHSRRV